MDEIYYFPTILGKLIFLFYFLITIFLFTKGLHYFLKNKGYQAALAKIFILLILIGLCAYGIYRSLQYSEKKWERDAGNESMIINAAYGFNEKGFQLNFGLPSTHYPKTNEVYTHFPPGPYWLAGLLFKLCGSGTLGCPRILSTLISSLALLFFAIMLYSSIGPFKSSVLIFFVAILPLTSNMIYTLHFNNYAFSLFIIQLGYLLYLFKKKIHLHKSHLTILFILGFVQGWFSFDYFFIICLSPLSFALLYTKLSQKEDNKRLVFATSSLFVGLCVAFLLHFIQNSFYFGSLTGAFEDLFLRAKYRASVNPGGNLDRTTITLNYFFNFPRSPYFFTINYPNFLIAILILIWFKYIKLTIQTPIKVNLIWSSSRHNYLVVLSALISSFLWIFIFHHNAATETAHLPRILFFPYFVCLLTVLECIKVDADQCSEVSIYPK